ncbi:MAG: hypothetical protein ABSH42_18130 [Bryobacteraceae bacterium]
MQAARLEKLLSSSDRSDNTFTATAGNGGTFANLGGIVFFGAWLSVSTTNVTSTGTDLD